MERLKRLKQITLEDGIFFALVVFALGSCISGHLSKNSEMVAIALCAIRLLRGNIPMERLRVVKHLLLVFGIFYGTMSISALRAWNLTMKIELYPIMEWAFEALLILCIALFVRTKRQVWILWMALFLSLLVVDFRQFYLVAHGAVRAGGFFKDIPTISIIYGLLVPPLAVLSVDMELGKRERNVFWGMLALGLMGAYATGARGVWLAILMAIAVMFACRGGWKRLLRCMAACILCFLVIALVASPQTRDRVAPERLGRDNSIMARFALYDAATEMFFEHPFLGVGMQQFNVHWREKCPSDKPDWQKLVNAHNTCLMYLSEGGLVGFGGYITFVGYLLWWAWKRRDTRWGLQLFGTVFSAFVQGMTGNEFGMHQAIRVYWMIIGLSFAAEAIVLEEGQTGETSDKNPVDR